MSGQFFIGLIFTTIAIDLIACQNLLTSPEQNKDSIDNDKRAAFIPARGRKAAFTAMRGKKMSPLDDSLEEYDVKRASAFMPSRGRKSGPPAPDYQAWAAGYYMPYMTAPQSVVDDELQQEKRAAFQAVLGKKEFSNVGDGLPMESGSWLVHDGIPNGNSYGEKRANAFFGMRGKRSVKTGLAHQR